jgi:hypothetical protein
MKRYLLSLLTLATVVFFGSMLPGCKASTEVAETDCGQPSILLGHKVIKYNPTDFFEMATKPARNDCEATYVFSFRWADPLRRMVDQDMPPIEDLEHAFQPLAEFAYFPHQLPAFEENTHVVDTNLADLPGDWYQIVFSTGNKNSGYPSTQYYCRARLDPSKATEADSTEIVAEIKYYKIKSN